MSLNWMRHPARRRLVFVLASVILALLSLFPRPYVARSELLPQESGGGLSALLGPGGAAATVGLGALLGSHQSIESDLAIGRSQEVLRRALTHLRVSGYRGFADRKDAEVAVRRKVEVNAVRGSILQISARDHDPAFAKAIVTAFIDSVEESLSELSLNQAGSRRAIATERLKEASARLVDAQAALERFRQANRLAAPEAELGTAVTQLAALQGRLQAKEVELQTVSQFATNANVSVQAIRAEIAGLKAQIATANNASSAATDPNLSAIAQRTSQYLNLYRDERFTQTLYEIYSRYLEQVTVDEMSANAIMDMIEPPFVDPARQFNPAPLGLLVLTLLLAVASEFYVLRPPPGRLAPTVSHSGNA